MTTSQLQPSSIAVIGSDLWVPTINDIISGSLPFSSRAGAYVDVRGSEPEWPGFAVPVPNFTFPGGAAVTGLSFDIYGHRESNIGAINDGAGNPQAEYGGAIFMSTDGQFTGKISASPVAHIDNLPLGTGNVSPANKITIGDSTTLWGLTQGQLKARLTNNSSPTWYFMSDIGTYNGASNPSTTNLSPPSGGKIGGLGTWSPSDVIGTITGQNPNATSWTPAVQQVTSASPNFRGIYLNLAPVSLPPGFKVASLEVKVYAQNQGLGAGGTVGKINVDGTNGGSKTVASSGMIFIAKGAATYANRLSGGGSPGTSHVDLFQTDGGTVGLTNVITLGTGGNLMGFSTGQELEDALTSPTGGTQLYLVIDNGVFYSPTPGTDIRTVEIGAVVMIVHGFLNEDRSRRTIAAIVCNAHYTVPGGSGGASQMAMLLIPEEDFEDSLLKDFLRDITKRP